MQRPHQQLRLNRRARTRGVGLIDAMIALAILAFGLFGLTRMQTNLVKQASESQARLTAAQLGDELLGTALVDVGNAPCYTVPVDGACTSATAKASTEAWEGRVKGALPGTVTVASALVDDQLTVTLTWTGKESEEQRTLEVTTDVRP
jgi:type IV pilus assembly protein PilV